MIVMKLSNEHRNLIEEQILQCEWRDIECSEDLECYSDEELVRYTNRHFPGLIEECE